MAYQIESYLQGKTSELFEAPFDVRLARHDTPRILSRWFSLRHIQKSDAVTVGILPKLQMDLKQVFEGLGEI